MASQEIPPSWPERDRFLEKVIIPEKVSGPVISAFEEVDRAEFMLREERGRAYSDAIIDLTQNRQATISQPSLVARMIDSLQLGGHERVLEIGTATGYQAAILSRLAAEVDTVEVDPRLAYWATSNLKRLQYSNVSVHRADGAKGLEKRAPFDAIIVTAGLKEVPQPLIEQLAIGGRLIAPVGDIPENSRLVLLTKVSTTEVSNKDLGFCTFVPLYSQENGGWTKETLKETREDREKELKARHAQERDRLKEVIFKNMEQEGYEEFIRDIGRPAASIVGKSLAESQVLDLFIFFSHVFKPEEETEEKQSESESGSPS